LSQAQPIDPNDPTLAHHFERMRAHGIHMIQVPTPFAIGPVNSYLIEDDPLTLVDPGPNSGDSLETLEAGVRALGHQLEDVKRVIVTHQHIDHLGLVAIVVARSDAEVTCLDRCAPWLTDYEAESSAADKFAVEMMTRHGIDKDTAIALRSVSRAFRGWGSSSRVDRVLHDGDMLEFAGRRLEVLHRPGHSISDTIFWDSEAKLLFAADHLIKKVSSNPLLERPRLAGEPRPQSLVNYIDSMKQTRQMPAELVLSGHGAPIDDHVGLIDARLEMHRKRAETLVEMLVDQALTAHELARKTWGNIAVTQAFLTLSEVIGHMDILVNAGRVTETEDGGLIKFRTAT
jgi:glyoxylase-like metal-dependent hydrolase (beta-lactamase superfamily II)